MNIEIIGIVVLIFAISLIIGIVICKNTKLGFTMPTFTALNHMTYGYSYPEGVPVPNRSPLTKKSDWAVSYDVGAKMEAGKKTQVISSTTMQAKEAAKRTSEAAMKQQADKLEKDKIEREKQTLDALQKLVR